MGIRVLKPSFSQSFNLWQPSKVQLRISLENELSSYSWQEIRENRKKLNFADQQVAFELRFICVGTVSLWVIQVLSRARTNAREIMEYT